MTEDVRWWKGDSKTRYERVHSLVQDVQGRNGYRRSLNLHHLRLYSDRQVSGLTAGTYARSPGGVGGYLDKRPRLSLNVVRNCIDSATSMITTARPRATFLTTGGDPEQQAKAKKRSQFVDAVFSASDAYQLGQRAFKDAAIFGTGIIKVCRDQDCIRLEKTFPGEVLIDDAEGIYGEPRTVFQVRVVDKLVLKELYPTKAKDIEDAAPPDTNTYGRGIIADQAVVVEAWHMPSGRDAGDGWHGIYCDKATLFEEKYAHECAPFAVMRWNQDTLGWWGTGLAQELTGIQFEINQLCRTVQSAMYMGGNLKILVEQGSQVVQAHINNDIRGCVVEYTGTKPEWVTNDAVSNQLLGHLQWLVQEAHALSGISELAARGEIPSGVTGSGKAMQVYQNIESRRFLTVQRNYERFFMDLAERVLEAASDLYEKSGNYFVNYVGDHELEEIGFEDIAGDKDEFVIQRFSTSALPNDPAGKYATVDQWKVDGYVDQAQAKKLLDLPDLKSELDLDLAPIELIDKRIDLIVSKAEYHPPHPRMDVQLALKRAVLAYQRWEMKGLAEDRLEMLGQFIDECQDLITAVEKAAQMQAAVGPQVGPAMAPTVTEQAMADSGGAPAQGAIAA